MNSHLSVGNPVHVVREGQGLPVVAVHGNGVDHNLLRSLDTALSSAGGIERVYLDLPGFGKTPSINGVDSLQQLADWLVEEISELVGDKPFALIANSMGGLLARYVRYRLPEQVVGIALIAPVVNPDSAKRSLPGFVVTNRDEELLQSLNTSDRIEFESISPNQTRASWELFRDHALPGIRAASVETMERLGESYFLEVNPDSAAGVFEGPALLLAGHQDHIVGFQDQLKLAVDFYPHASIVVLQGAGHNVHLDAPEVAEALVRDWAKQLLRRMQ